jgi:membrane protein implicated in regulation of membrane protease activity
MFHTHAIYALTLRPLVNVLIWTVFTIVTVVILAALTGIFVLWLILVGILIAALAISDLVHRSVRRWAAPPIRMINRQAVG